MNKINGFSLIEASIALLIIGLLLGPVLHRYSIDIRKNKIEMTTSNLMTVRSAIGNYYTRNQAYPMPAKPAAGFNDDDFGIAITPGDLPSVGSCNSDGICLVPGLADLVDNTTMAPPPDGLGETAVNIIIGSVPFSDLMIPSKKAADGWSNKFIYAVTEPLTDQGTFDVALASINLADSSGTAVSTSSGYPHIFLGSAGPNGVGAYNLNGTQVSSCTAGSPDEENCDSDFIFGIGISDDFYLTITEVPVGFWTYANPGVDDDIMNTNVGSIGIGTDKPSNVDLNGDGTVETGIKLDVGGSIQTAQAHGEEFCDHNGNCFRPEIIASSGPSGPYLDCSGNGAMQGIAKGDELCRVTLPVSACTCPAGEVIKGFDASGNCTCGALP